MAIAFDAADAEEWNESGAGDTLTKAHTCTGSDLILFIGFATYNGTLVTTHASTVPTYNGVAMTKIGNGLSSNLEGNFQATEMWYLDDPATGANNIVVVMSGDP